jgi:putative spermidine/putrescine transport system permease protein
LAFGSSGEAVSSTGTATLGEAMAPAFRAGRVMPVLQRSAVLALIVCGGLVIFVPLLLTLYLSLFDETIILFPPKGYTLHWYGAMVQQFAGPLLVSLEIGLASVVASLLVGVPAGLALARYRFRGRDAVSTLLLAPLTVPGVAIGLAIFCFAVLIEENTGLALSSSIAVLIAAHVLITTPWVVRLCLAGLANHDRAAEEAAASLGARPLEVIWRVTLPAMRQGIVAAALFAFIVSFENLEMTLFLISPGLTTLPIAVLQYLQYHIDPMVAAIAVAQMAVIGAALLLLDRYVKLGRVVQ